MSTKHLWKIWENEFYKTIESDTMTTTEPAEYCVEYTVCSKPDSKVHGANMGPNWVLSAPDGPHVDPMNLAIKEALHILCISWYTRFLTPVNACFQAFQGQFDMLPGYNRPDKPSTVKISEVRKKPVYCLQIPNTDGDSVMILVFRNLFRWSRNFLFQMISKSKGTIIIIPWTCEQSK